MEKIIFINQDIPDDMLASIVRLGLNSILLPPSDKLLSPVSAHADILLFKYNNRLVVGEAYYNKNKHLFSFISDRLVISREEPHGSYPSDVSFDALAVGERLFCRRDATSQAIINMFDKITNVRQGYARCSCCMAGDNAIITSDASVSSALVAQGIDCLVISAGNVELLPYDCGFIGGASFLYGNTVYFFGCVEKHPDYIAMRDFAAKHGCSLASLSRRPLIDLGGAVII